MYIAGVNRAVDTGDTYFNEIGTSLAKQIQRTRELVKSKSLSDKPPLSARVNHGRWVVSCPNCNNVEFAFEDGLFYCSDCKNGDDKPIRVSLPKERTEIENILGKRLIVNRHWTSAETVEALLVENIKYGIEEV